MVATLQQDPQVTHCSNCPFAHHIEGDRYSCGHFNEVTRGHWEATHECKWAVEDEQSKAQEELGQSIEAQANTIAPEHLSDADKIKIAQHLQTVGGIYDNLYRVDPANIESKLNPTPGKYGEGYVDLTFGQHLSSSKLRSGKYSDWFAGGSCVMPIKLKFPLGHINRIA